MAAPLAGQAGVVLRNLALRSARLRGSFPVSEPGPGPPHPAGSARRPRRRGMGGGPRTWRSGEPLLGSRRCSPSPQPPLCNPLKPPVTPRPAGTPSPLAASPCTRRLLAAGGRLFAFRLGGARAAAAQVWSPEGCVKPEALLWF